MLNSITELLPPHVSDFVQTFPTVDIVKLEEVRMRIGQPIECLFSSKPIYSSALFSEEDSVYFLNQLSQYSMYAFEEELQKGYITIQGGHRVGLAGKTILENGVVKTIRPVSSFNIRVARQKIGVGEKLATELYDQRMGWRNALLIGPPQTGKTTVLRDLARIVSQGTKKIPSNKVAIVDERSEIAGSINGIPQHELAQELMC